MRFLKQIERDKNTREFEKTLNVLLFTALRATRARISGKALQVGRLTDLSRVKSVSRPASCADPLLRDPFYLRELMVTEWRRKDNASPIKGNAIKSSR